MKQVKELPQDLRATETMHFTAPPRHKGGKAVEMIGTYSTIPELRWAVIAQRGLDNARLDAGVQELTAQALSFVVVVTFVALLLGIFSRWASRGRFAGLVESTRAMSRSEFHERVEVRGAAEIGELAETFNQMAGHIEQYVDQLQAAPRKKITSCSWARFACSRRPSTKRTPTRGAIPAAWRAIRRSSATALGMNAEDLDRLRIAALLHDVGKIGVDDRVLKKPGQLTDEEFDLMKQHTVKGANIMRPVAQLKDVLPGIELHHERMDGKGYPYGLPGRQIPLMARIIAVADTLDAITTNRPYQSAMDLDFALERIRSLAISRFDPKS